MCTCMHDTKNILIKSFHKIAEAVQLQVRELSRPHLPINLALVLVARMPACQRLNHGE